MAKSSDEKLLTIILQLQGGGGVAVGGRDHGKGDPAMDFILGGLGSKNTEIKKFEGGGGQRPNPLTKAMRRKAKVSAASKPTNNPLAKVLGIRR